MKVKYLYLLFIIFFDTSNVSHASVVVDGTRMIFKGDKREQSLHVHNPDKSPQLVQAWIEGEFGKENVKTFIITPPLFRLNTDISNVLRITRITDSLPKNKESLFWINIKSIQQSQKNNDKNQLEIAIKTRIKLIYRPQSLRGTSTDVADKILWKCHASELSVYNPTPFYINFHSVKMNGVDVNDVTYISPYKSLNIHTSHKCKGSIISWELLNDFGNIDRAYNMTV
ncbi:fimbria/pilus periplasmic chaperone [Escherichia coli]|uniref:fimbrial biogenesis chaperone n=1 Tax=Escherichia coli TaxID=562 RepID=UPI0013A0940F|nr:fimbria/pilus periplasmic chaperone [Escherichia coli]QIB19483.1 fimbria/pilus periplasmic chaperone [Escherichia coli]